MKNGRILAAAAIAFAALAAAVPAKGSTGDIVDIRAVDTATMRFGGHASLYPGATVCSASDPLRAGEDLYIRVRMLVRNYAAARSGMEPPQTWYFASGALGGSSLNPPKLGLMIGPKSAYAALSDTGPYAWQKSGELKTDDAGNASTDYRFFTDFYFKYTVQAGDLGLPVKLMNSAGTGAAASVDDDNGYYLLNCSDDGQNHWKLQNSAEAAAKFSYASELTLDEDDWPAGIAGDGLVRNYDLSGENVFMKTIDFDSENAAGEAYSDGDVWRNVYPGMSIAPGTQPKLVVQGGALTEQTAVYVWSADESIVEPAASGANTIDTVDGKKVLTVIIPAGATEAAFALAGAAGATVGAQTNIYMSSVKDVVSTAAGKLVDVAVSRKVEVVAAPAPTVKMYLNGDKSSAQVTADALYDVYKATLVFKVEPAASGDVTLNLGATINGGSSITGMYDNNYIRICDSEDYNPESKPTTVTIPAGETSVTKYVFVLGASTLGDLADTENGIRFAHTIKTAPADVVAEDRTCLFKIFRGGDSNPIPILAANPADGSVVTMDPGTKQFQIKIADTFRSMSATTPGNTGYTIYMDDVDDFTSIKEEPNKMPNARGQLTLSLPVDKSLDGRSVVLYALSPDGETYTEEVAYTLKVNDSKQVLVSPLSEGVYTVGEGESFPLTLSLNKSLNATKYIFLDGASAADGPLFTSAQKTTGVSVGPNPPYTASTTATFVDGKNGDTVVNIKAFLSESQTDPTQATVGWSEGTVSITVTNKPPALTSLTFGGTRLTPADDGITLDDAVTLGVEKTFALTASDVAADLDATGTDAFQVRWDIDGTPKETTGNPNGQSVSHAFTTAKDKATVSVYMKDKDMDAEQLVFTFYVKVSEKPTIELTTSAASGTLQEGDKTAWVAIELSESPSEAITVRLSVSQTTDGGFLRLQTTAGSVEEVAGEPGKYDVTFNAGQRQRQIAVSEMDGTSDTALGLQLNASVVTDTVNPQGVKWCDYYSAAPAIPVKVQNDQPVSTAVTFNGIDIGPSTVLSPVFLGVENKFSLRASDVTADLTNVAFDVKWQIDGGAAQETHGNPNGQNVTHTFTGAADRDAPVSVWLKDKDMADYPVDPAYSFSVPLKAKPYVTVAAGSELYQESDANSTNAYVLVTLSESASAALKVRVTVAQAADGGFLKLRTSSTVEEVAGEPGKYDVTFAAGQRQRQVTINEMDGTADTFGGLDVNAAVVTADASPYGIVWKDFYTEAETITVRVQNVEPVLSSVMFGGKYLNSSDNDKTLDAAIPLGVTVTNIYLTAKDAVADLTNNEFSVEWNIDGATYTTNAAGVVSHTFENEGRVAVQVRLKDKDMAAYPEEINFRFYVNVVARPVVSVEAGGTGSYEETAVSGPDSYIRVVLSEKPGIPATVRLTVPKAYDGGYLRLKEVTDSVVRTNETEAAIEYDVLFGSGETERTISFSGMDGTAGTQAGLSITARVTTEEPNSYGMPLKDFYATAGYGTVRIYNVAPSVIRPSEDEVAYTNENASANTPYYIHYAASDVYSDLHADDPATNVTVVIAVDGNEVLTTNVFDSTDSSWPVTFSDGGTPVHKVRVSFTDKDGGVDSREMVFRVRPAKNLRLTAHGPGPMSGSGTGYSALYAGASGLGAGRVYAGEDGPQKVENFTHFYSFGTRAEVAAAFAVGYKADGNADDGGLTPSPDKGIDKYGNWTKDVAIADYYNYTAQHYWGRRGYDSFVYAWLNNDPKASGTLLRTFTMGEQVYQPIPLPESNDDASSYPVQYWEAVFSREYLPSDNCGDINADGIPDLVVFQYGLGIFESGQLVKTSGEADLTDVSAYNADLDKDGGAAPDFLPVSSDTSIYGQLIPGLSGTWVDTGKEFDAKTEVRGCHDGLNDAMEQLGFQVESDRVYAEDDGTGNWGWTANCSISELEYIAWTEYAAANGLDPHVADNWKRWSPERPTSPVRNDTDGDGFTDGYEYYFWYKAHVGYMVGNVHKRLTGRRYDPRNPGDGTMITAEEIAARMDPRVSDGESAKTRDIDNDGLPDLLEFMIGTNPFDFDTDGDCLPDGWELMIAGLNPLLVQTSVGALVDGMRNYDGDAMAITSYRYERVQNPAPVRPERCRFTTFALIDQDGDTDGVQWYTTTNSVEVVTNMLDKVDKPMWLLTLDDDTKVLTLNEPKVTADGRLAVSLTPPDEAFIANELEDDESHFDRGWPVYLPAGTVVKSKSDETTNAWVYTLNEGIAAANAAWIYGRGAGNASRGAVSGSAADYGCLALGRSKTAPKGSDLCALPSEDRDVALLHYLVYQQCGFDPRTAWCPRDPIAARWGQTVESATGENEIVEGLGNANVQHPARTREYRTYDEFLVYSFFVNNGCDMSGFTPVLSESAPYLAKVWGAFTTNPQGPNEPDRIQLAPSSAAQSAVGWSQYFFGTQNDNGADTDLDGVPDGWELYVMSGPKKGPTSFTFANPYEGFKAKGAEMGMEFSYFSPFLNYAQKTETLNKNYVGNDADDKLTEYQEFEGTDSIAWYADYSETVVHVGEWKWFNKFLPTDPWSKDTDGDGIDDKKEGSSFAYGTPADDGKLTCIPGGGLNPCSVDTDLDGLPDKWEDQFKGKTPFPGKEENGTLLPDNIVKLGDKAKDADGNEIGNYLQGLIDGMDGTTYDAMNSPLRYNVADGKTKTGTKYVSIKFADYGVKQIVNRDYDHDGLENWQEYFTGMMRCWRYDDPRSPWIPIPKAAYAGAKPDLDLLQEWFQQQFDLYPAFKQLYEHGELISGSTYAERLDNFWFQTLVDKSSILYNPHFVTDVAPCSQYLSKATNGWDVAYGNYYWFYDRVDGQKLSEVWVNDQTVLAQHEPSKYACCSPLDADSDHDGMDDYYELFHGMNPLLGMSGVWLSSGAPCDLVYDSWGDLNNPPLYTAVKNFWGNFYDRDFRVALWLNGMADADPDGDGVPNQTEALMPKISAPAMHTDPTPLWMTDSTYTNSLVRRFYRMPNRYWFPFTDTNHVYDVSDLRLNVEDGSQKTSFKHKFSEGGEVTYWFRDFDGWDTFEDEEGNPHEYFGGFNPDVWAVAAYGMPNWMFSFEENEGYDTDHDGTGDEDEQTGKVRGATDPQDFDSPRRRQAMYFQGPSRPSALQTLPQAVEDNPVGAVAYPDDMAFRTFTVECWARPESLEDSVLVERSVWIGQQNPGDEEHMRKNFQLAIKDGKWYAKFDPFGTRADDAVEVFSAVDASDDRWTHVAATYDGTTLVLYVNGTAEATRLSGLMPAYGAEAAAVTEGQSYWFNVDLQYKAVIVGASAKTEADGVQNGYALDVSYGIGWDAYTKFYKGWIDEVRVWDGARTPAEIAASRDERFNAEMAAANREEFAAQWLAGKRRDAKDTDGSAQRMPAELRCHWSFDSIFGAQNETALATAPGGFGGARALASRPDGYEVAWWKAVCEGIDGTPGYAGGSYGDMAWVPWIQNTVAHLPRYDGTTLDSMFWSRDFMGAAAGTYWFASSAEPVSFWTQMRYNLAGNSLYYDAPGSRHFLVNTLAVANGDESLKNVYEFSGRYRARICDDLLPLGGAYARYCDNDVGLWDGQGASGSWEITGSDTDGDGLADWWEVYADENYRPAGMDPSEQIGWSTLIVRNGVEMTAGEAYLRDLAAGFYMDADGEAVAGSPLYEQIADGSFSGIPDWWEDMYGIAGESGLADHDGDGLPNCVEYLLSEVFRFEGVAFDPTNPRSVDPSTPDYFYRVGKLYVGELFTDHDLVDDAWEDSFPTLGDGETKCASRYEYDPAADADDDGWGNRSECRAGTRPDMSGMLILDDGAVQEHPVPLVRVNARYAEKGKIDAPLVVKAYSGDGNGAADATWTVASNNDAVDREMLIGLNKGTDMTINLGPGETVLGSVHVYFRDPNEASVSETGSVVYSDPLSSVWRVGMKESTVSGDPLHTTLGAGIVFGAVDYKSGLATIRFGDVPKYLYHYSSGTWGYGEPAASNAYTRVDTSASYVKVSWQNKRVSAERSWSFSLSKADSGHLREGRNTFVAFADLNANGSFDEGEPYGMVQGVDVSWSSTTVNIELTDSSPVTPRFDLWVAGAVNVAVTNFGDTAEVAAGQRRIRVVRWRIDDIPVCTMKFDKNDYVVQRVVAEKMIDSAAERTITEADILDESTFDLDWEHFCDEAVSNALCRQYVSEFVKAEYLVLIDYASREATNNVWNSSEETNKWVLASQRVLARYYGKEREIPEPLPVGIVEEASPTFRWTVGGPEREGYTAFRIQVTSTNDDADVVYDSGIRRAPPRDAEGAYRWTAPIYVDDVMPNGSVLSNKTAYSWRVAMYNSKFRSDEFSTNTASFFMNVQTNTASSGTAPVRVRYFGPEKSFEDRVVRVQAFRSPDFSGQPVAAGYVHEDGLSGLAETGVVYTVTNANCRVVGLPQGTYYLRAFIDSNTNGVCDAWESSGWYTRGYGLSSAALDPAPVGVGPTSGLSDLVTIFIEDADTDHDGLPDSWEYAEYGSLEAKAVELLDETPAGEALVNSELVGELEVREKTKSGSSSLATHARLMLRNAGTLALAAGASTSGYDSFAAAISGSVSEKLADDGVKIASLELADGKVTLTVVTETEGGVVGSPLLSSATHLPTVVAKVYWKASLSDDWTLVKTSDPFTAGGDAVVIDVGEPGDGASGFYQVVVE